MNFSITLKRNEEQKILKWCMATKILPLTQIWTDCGGAFSDLESWTDPETDEPLKWKHGTVNHSGSISFSEGIVRS